jgi:nicotinamidase-related amidase
MLTSSDTLLKKMKTTALVLLECQNEFLAKDGKLYSMVQEVVLSNNIVENINSAIYHAREKEMLIIHVPMTFSKGHPEVGTNPYGILEIVRSIGAFEKDTWGWQIFSEIDVRDEDIVIAGKSSICSFSGTNLDYVLRSHGVSTIALGGLLTNICIESTMRTAYSKGYTTHALIDCMATIGKAEQEAAIAYTFPMFSHPISSQAFFE